MDEASAKKEFADVFPSAAEIGKAFNRSVSFETKLSSNTLKLDMLPGLHLVKLMFTVLLKGNVQTATELLIMNDTKTSKAVFTRLKPARAKILKISRKNGKEVDAVQYEESVQDMFYLQVILAQVDNVVVKSIVKFDSAEERKNEGTKSLEKINALVVGRL